MKINGLGFEMSMYKIFVYMWKVVGTIIAKAQVTVKGFWVGLVKSSRLFLLENSKGNFWSRSTSGG